jgi:hypothetical protein
MLFWMVGSSGDQPNLKRRHHSQRYPPDPALHQLDTTPGTLEFFNNNEKSFSIETPRAPEKPSPLMTRKYSVVLNQLDMQLSIKKKELSIQKLRQQQ